MRPATAGVVHVYCEGRNCGATLEVRVRPRVNTTLGDSPIRTRQLQPCLQTEDSHEEN